jgi:hypothetical protein
MYPYRRFRHPHATLATVTLSAQNATTKDHSLFHNATCVPARRMVAFSGPPIRFGHTFFEISAPHQLQIKTLSAGREVIRSNIIPVVENLPRQRVRCPQGGTAKMRAAAKTLLGS